MDAIKFIEERNRMCDTYKGSCAFCPANSEHCFVGMESCLVPEAQVKIIEKWPAEHPRKTRQSVFLEQWPETQLDDTGVLSICLAIITPAHRINGGGCTQYHKKCSDCRREFWMQEIE